MKRNQTTNSTPTTKKDEKVGELLKKLQELDQDQLENVHGGMEAGRGRCGSRCMHHHC